MLVELLWFTCLPVDGAGSVRRSHQAVEVAYYVCESPTILDGLNIHPSTALLDFCHINVDLSIQSTLIYWPRTS